MNLCFRAPMRRRLTIVVCVALGFSVGAASARSPISLEVLRRDGYGSVDLEKGGQNRLFVPAEINGKKIRLLLDTGWGADGITLGVKASEFGIVAEKGPHAVMSASGARTRIAHGVAQSVAMGNVRIVGTPIYFGRFYESGILGHGFLKRNSAIIDLTNLRLYLRPPGKGHRVDLGPALTAVGMAQAPFAEASHGSYVINVEVNGAPTQMALDTGAQLTMLDRRFAQAAHTRGWGRDVRQIDAAGKISPADFAGTKTFKIEGIPIRTPVVALARFAGYDLTGGKMVGLLGLDVIGMNWGIIDVAQQKFYFTPAR